MRTEYVPEIKILRRPKSPVQAVKATHTKSKPLAQREADYNAAREKIFGPSSSSSPSSSTSSALTKNTNNNASAAANPSSNSRSGSGSSSPSGSGSPMDLKPIAFKGDQDRITQLSDNHKDQPMFRTHRIRKREEEEEGKQGRKVDQ
ncbi:hypothetical protein BGZ58_006987 [Dissophora ornata]|nr:hypothetical protein BGZ58_006987 [Dissophora ornata]